jgi:hypothetical protein
LVRFMAPLRQVRTVPILETNKRHSALGCQTLSWQHAYRDLKSNLSLFSISFSLCSLFFSL